MSGFDVARVRGLYAALGSGTAYLEGGLAALQPESVVRSIIGTLRMAPSAPGARTSRSRYTENAAAQARRAITDLVGGHPDDVVLGSTSADLMLRLAALLDDDWQLGDEIVLSRLDSDLYLQSWLWLARAKGAIIRWAEVDLETGELPAWQYERLIGPRTRIVTVALGNPVTGALPDINAIATLAHRHGALVVADAGIAVNHVPLDLDDLEADVLSLSASTFGGPSVAALVMRTGLLSELDAAGRSDVTAAMQVELAPLPIELLDGVAAAVDHLADLDQSVTGSRRTRVLHSLTAAGEHTAELFGVLDTELRSLDGVTVIGASADRLPVLAFTIDGWRPEKVADALAAKRISVWTGPVHLTELSRTLGVDEVGGAIHVGVMPYTNRAEIRRLIDALDTLG